MGATFRPCLDVLPAAQRQLWPLLQPAARCGFVLYGGTAIALRLGHRVSVDFDFFSDGPLARDGLLGAMPCLRDATVLQDQTDTITFLAHSSGAEAQPVKLSFFGSIGFGRVGQPQFTNDGVICAASMEDLLATKLKVILQRPESKDYRDIDAMLGAGADLANGLASARALFGTTFQPSESLKALSYFGDGDLASLDQGTRYRLIAAAAAVRDLPKVERVAGKLIP